MLNLVLNLTLDAIVFIFAGLVWSFLILMGIIKGTSGDYGSYFINILAVFTVNFFLYVSSTQTKDPEWKRLSMFLFLTGMLVMVVSFLLIITPTPDGRPYLTVLIQRIQTIFSGG